MPSPGDLEVNHVRNSVQGPRHDREISACAAAGGARTVSVRRACLGRGGRRRAPGRADSARSHGSAEPARCGRSGRFGDGGNGRSRVVPERSRGFGRRFPASCLSLAAFPRLAGRTGSGCPSARPAGGGLRGLDAGRSGAVRSDRRQLLLPERPSLRLGGRAGG